jgi:hypothetical protein
MSMTEAQERLAADSFFGGGLTTWAPATWYLGLSSTTPADDGTGFTEPSGSAYARAALTNNSTNFPPAATSDGVTRKTNGAKFTMPNPTGTWGHLTHWGLFSSASGGQPRWTGPLDAAIDPRNGHTGVEFDVGQIIITFD